MFERYTEKARRVIFFARYEASQFGSPYIETEHLLLGLVREDKALTNRLLRSHASVESIRKQIEGHTTIREKVSTSVDLPLSSECKRVLAYAADEAALLSHKYIGTEHLLLGLLREQKCFAAEILHERGLRLSIIRDDLARTSQEKSRPSERSVGRRKRSRAVLVLSSHLSDLAPYLRHKNFYPIILPAGPLDQQQKEWWLPDRTLVTDRPEQLNDDDVAVLGLSVIDISKVKAEQAALADIISIAWTNFRLNAEGWFVLRLHPDGEHNIEFPE